ncbi:DUF6968 family protein [Methylobacterium sp. Leaf99]|uniref:DUF6968 family protein n=1 Tax=Methylobacterium sp. Leaf99 TaxID=1736251 RepID=UPI000AE35702|nr:hypothetical protein [Methylobacterium sp. Leaf99]
MIIASRMLKFQNKGSELDVKIDIHMPEPNESDWICRYDIQWPDSTQSNFAKGSDSIQALHLGLQRICLDLYMSEYHATGNLFWSAPGGGYGFPITRNGRSFLIGDDKTFEG